MPIPWDDTNWSDVSSYLDANPPAPSGMAKFWNDLLWGGEPGPHTLFKDPRQSLDDMGGMFRRDVVQPFTDAAGDAVDDAASSTLRTITPYLAVGAALWLVLEIRKAR